MNKIVTRFVCSECGYESSKWLGRCPGCSNWNSLIEETVNPAKSKTLHSVTHPIPLQEITQDELKRMPSGNSELDRVLGGGIVPGSLILLGGDPGIGKSTLLLQVASDLARSGQKVVYLSGEESMKQLRLRSLRLGIEEDGVYLLNEQNIDQLEASLQDLSPAVVIIDSIQTVYTSRVSSIPGSVAQLRECTALILEYAKRTETTFFLVGHVTKEGALAGPRVLEHIVDVVIYFEGDKNVSFRLLRGVKNRYGSTDEIGLMEMSGQGLVEVNDPSYVFLSPGQNVSSGTAVSSSFEGSRPLLIEVQSLVVSAGPGYGRRMASGIDQNRLALIIAILEKRLDYPLTAHDVYLKVTGGLFLKDPSVDLAIAAAIVSSYREKPIAADTVFIGELSLSGQIRPVPFLEQRLKEIDRMGFRKVILPESSVRRVSPDLRLEIIEIRTIDDLVERIMEG